MISILGAGAIGQLLAHKLTDAAIDCQFIVPDSEQYSENAWKITQQNEIFEHKITVSQIDEETPIDILWLCVKAHQVESALDHIQHRLHSKSTLLLWQNGMGHQTIACQFFDDRNIFFASNTHGAYRQSKQHVVYAGKGYVDLGALSECEKPHWLTKTVCSAIDGQWQPNIETILWRKLLVNAVINPLTAIYQCKNGDLLETDKQLKLLALIDENRKFSERLSLPFSEQLKSIVLQVIEQTANNQSSMLQDIQQNKMTEIAHINGFLLEQITKHQFHAPHNWKLWSDFHILYPPLKNQTKNRIKHLSAEQFHVTQQKGTERPFTGIYNIHNAKGQYLCVVCDSILFNNQGKFDSGCGWPSFDRAQSNKAIAYQEDFSHGMHRVEILCSQCGSHLGHIFEDGPTETGQRFCVNSLSLNFKPQ